MNIFNGILVVFSSPSGGGKTTICRNIAEFEESKKGFAAWYSVSCTTRPPRGNEQNGRDYIFISKKEFIRMIDNNEFLEYEKVYDHLYGTPLTPINNHLKKGDVVLLDLDVKGALNLKRKMPGVFLIFLLPPSKSSLIDRLKRRGDLSEEELNKRLSEIKKEIEMALYYDRVIVNDDLKKTVSECINCIKDALNNFRDASQKISKFIENL